jgi:hypothetical protein
MAGLKVTLDAAMRARDVSEPSAAQERQAELDLPAIVSVRREVPAIVSVRREVPAPRQPVRPPADNGSRPRPVPGPGRQPGPRQLASRGEQAGPDRQPGFRPRGPQPDGPAEDETEPPVQPRMRRRSRLVRITDQCSGGSWPDQCSGGSWPDFS